MAMAATMEVAASSLIPKNPMRPKFTMMAIPRGMMERNPAAKDRKNTARIMITIRTEERIFQIWDWTIISVTPFSMKAIPANSMVIPSGKWVLAKFCAARAILSVARFPVEFI